MDNNNYHSINNSDNNNMRPITELDSDTTDFKSPELNKKFNSAHSFFKENKNDPSKPLLRRTDDVDDEGGYSFCCCTPFSETFRIFVLIFSCLLTYGSYYSYDNPAALTEYFKQHLCHNDTFNYLALYSVYSWPNTIQPFIGGWIIDSYLGVGKAAVVFSGLVLLGTAIVATAGSLYSIFPADSYVPFYIAIFGRFVFGLGGESLSVAQSTMTGKWFRGHDGFLQIATAFAITLSFSRIGSATNFVVETPVAKKYGFTWALWVSVLLCLASFCVSITLSYMDRLGEKANVVVGITNNGSKKDNNNDDSDDDDGENKGESINCSSVMQAFKLRECLIYVICVTFYVPVFVFIQVAAEFFMKKYDATEDDASLYVAIPYSVSAIASPFLGFILDKVGFSIHFVILACVSLCSIHLSFAFTDLDPTYGMVWMGVTYAICAASLWPMVALIVPLDNLGSAYGLMTALQNLGLAVAPLSIAPILGKTATIDQYKTLEIVFSIISGVAVVCSLFLFLIDKTCYQSILSSSARDVKTIQAGRLKHLSPSSALEKGLDALLSPNTDHLLKAEEIAKLKVRMKTRSQSFSAI